jgi:hypothetical protein
VRATLALTRSAPIFLDHDLLAPMTTTADRLADSPVGQILVRHRSLLRLNGAKTACAQNRILLADSS